MVKRNVIFLIKIYDQIVSRYYRIHTIFCCIAILVFILLGYFWLSNHYLLTIIQNDCHPVLIGSALVLTSGFHATCLWLYVRQMPNVLEQIAQQNNMDENNRRVFGLTRRDVYHRYLTDLCFFNGILVGILFLVTQSVN